LLFLAPLAGAAQSEVDDVGLIAASWVLKKDGIAALGDFLLVDTLHGASFDRPVDPPAAEPAWAGTRIRLATALGARAGTMADHLQCPSEPPDPEALAAGVRRGCRLDGGIRAVLQLGEPHPHDEGTVIVVATHYFEQLREDHYNVIGFTREVLLRRTPDGGWMVDRVLRAAIGG
jgi:hypothetical protein